MSPFSESKIEYDPLILSKEVFSDAKKEHINEKEETEERIRQPCVVLGQKVCFSSQKQVTFQNGTESQINITTTTFDQNKCRPKQDNKSRAKRKQHKLKGRPGG